MLSQLKKRLYFVVARYFAFWARLVLRRWKPRIVVITGSSGKTTLLQLVEAQLGEQAVYSHHANSAIGVPFHILGMEPNILNRAAWFSHALLAPFCVFRKLPKTKLYIVEADNDRPQEGAFLARLLKPEVTLWVSVYNTHSLNFDKLVKAGRFASHEAAIAFEFGHFIENTRKLAIVNADQAAIKHELSRLPSGVKLVEVSLQKVSAYGVEADATSYTVNSRSVRVAGLHPKELGISLQMVDELLAYLDQPLDPNYQAFRMPPGRGGVFAGKQGTTLIDSTYNTGLGATAAMLQLFQNYPKPHKWLVLGDIIELGSLEADEHKKLAEEIAKVQAERIILLGPRTRQYTLPALKQLLPAAAVDGFETPKEVLDFISSHIKGGETIFFKGGRFLEGVIEQLLNDPKDASQLVRREPVWVKRRQAWGLPR